MSWNSVLETYARLADPRKDLPAGVHLISDDYTVAIFDGYEKAKYHFLVMPREPFKYTNESGAPLIVPPKDLVTLNALLRSSHALPVLRSLQKAGSTVKAMIQDEMLKDEGWVWDVQVGFHAVESMKQVHVHLHVISSDLISPKLKNKKHYNSFHPEIGFFLHLEDVLEQVEQGSIPSVSESTYNSMLKDPLVSFYPGKREFKTIPQLKEHLESEWAKAGRVARQKNQQEKGDNSLGEKRSGDDQLGGDDKKARTE
ncbi:hypothetical protein T439DRAFT_311739 [Meredithblackwellia eburnea MCA 4105]